MHALPETDPRPGVPDAPRDWTGSFYRRGVDTMIRRDLAGLTADAIRDRIDAAVGRADYATARRLARELDRRTRFVVLHLTGRAS